MYGFRPAVWKLSSSTDLQQDHHHRKPVSTTAPGDLGHCGTTKPYASLHRINWKSHPTATAPLVATRSGTTLRGAAMWITAGGDVIMRECHRLARLLHRVQAGLAARAQHGQVTA